MIIIVLEFIFLGINIFWALLRTHFNPRLTARAKMSLSRAQNMSMPANINSTVVIPQLAVCYISELSQAVVPILRSRVDFVLFI